MQKHSLQINNVHRIENEQFKYDRIAESRAVSGIQGAHTKSGNIIDGTKICYNRLGCDTYQSLQTYKRDTKKAGLLSRLKLINHFKLRNA